MKYWYDTEFYEDGKQVHLISIGIVSEDGRALYLENKDFDWDIVPAGHWLWENVYPHLQHGRTLTTKQNIAGLVHGFITNGSADFDNELWGYYSAYDHVVLAQLFGRMVDMPHGVPWFTMDLKQELVRRPNADISWIDNDNEHNALADARWNKRVYYYLKEGDRDWP